MDAIISDIHGNLEALLAVLDAIRDMQVARIICLGDVVGYGPDSIACARVSANFDIAIMGYWDATLLSHDPEQWNPFLNRHIEYVRTEFDNAVDAESLYSAIRSYKDCHIEAGLHYVHGTPRDRRDMVVPEEVYNPGKLNRLADCFGHACISGNAHINGTFRRNRDMEWDFMEPKPGICYQIGSGDKAIVIVGAVGQPRDDDPRLGHMPRTLSTLAVPDRLPPRNVHPNARANMSPTLPVTAAYAPTYPLFQACE